MQGVVDGLKNTLESFFGGGVDKEDLISCDTYPSVCSSFHLWICIG